MKEMIKKYRGSLISSILIILTEMSQTGAFYRLNSHNFVTKFSIFYICFLNCLNIGSSETNLALNSLYFSLKRLICPLSANSNKLLINEVLCVIPTVLQAYLLPPVGLDGKNSRYGSFLYTIGAVALNAADLP